MKSKVINYLREYKEWLIEALLSNTLIKDTYSIQMKSGTVFKW